MWSTWPTPRPTPYYADARQDFAAGRLGVRPIPHRCPTASELERRLAEYEAKYPGEDIPRPPHWSGFRVIPERFEFWQNMPFRLHDRTVYTRAANGGWAVGKLFP